MIINSIIADIATAVNEPYARKVVQILFVVLSLITVILQVRKHKFQKADFFKNNTLIYAGFTLLLISSVFSENTGIAGTAIFITVACFHFFRNVKLYQPNNIFYFIFLYAVLLLTGTVNTPEGFRFPEPTYTFYLLPLSLSLFTLNKKTLFRAGYLFFKVMLIYMFCCVIYFIYNFQYIDISLTEWITQKSYFREIMPDWEKQDAYFFVNKWAGYSHPTFVSLVLFMGLITGFYLFYKRDFVKTVTLSGLSLYIFLCLIMVLLMESRVGLIIFSSIFVFSLVYYSIVKRKYAVPLSLAAIFLSVSIFFIVDTKLTDDNLRSDYRKVAINYIKRNPYWGCGYHEQQSALDEQIALDSVHVKKRLNCVHNQFLGDFVQYGVVGLAVLLTFFAGVLFYGIKWKSYPLQMFVLVVVLCMMIDEPFYVQVGITRVTIFLVFFTALTSKQRLREWKILK
ncbi:MAG: O-antigen ligase family protein [Bacteroidales bacterium]|jgi:hypothetical protein|nr:O-antigen ligase family protein [Bacteroidales bacterium]